MSADLVTTFADLHDRLVRNLHECGLALAVAAHDRSVLDDRTVEAVAAAREMLDRAIRDIQTTAFAVRQHTRPASPAGEAGRRYVVRIEDEGIIAYADGDGHDFRRVHDDSIWAHESDGVLLLAKSGRPLARRSGLIYHDIVTDLPLFYQSP